MSETPTEPVVEPVQSTWPPKQIDKIERTNITRARDQHPKDHEDLELAVNAVIDILGDQPAGASESVTNEVARLQIEINTKAMTPGPIGPQGPQGATGEAGPKRFFGEGPPGLLIGARPADEYLDRLTGDLYILQ